MVIAIQNSNTASNTQTLSGDLAQLKEKLRVAGRFILSIVKGFFRLMLVPCEIQTRVDEARTSAMMRRHL